MVGVCFCLSFTENPPRAVLVPEPVLRFSFWSQICKSHFKGLVLEMVLNFHNLHHQKYKKSGSREQVFTPSDGV